jgi:hypothetical protein
MYGLVGQLGRAAGHIRLQLEAIKQPLQALAIGVLEGDWEGARELVLTVVDTLRQVRPGLHDGPRANLANK